MKVAIFFLLSLLLLWGGPGSHCTGAPLTEEEQVISAVEKVKPSVVNISTQGAGTGAKAAARRHLQQ
jgi:hypothetical protein